MSGSPLLNQRTGKICGIVKFTRDRSIDLGGGAISTSTILAQFPQLRELQQEFHERDRRWSTLLPTTAFNASTATSEHCRDRQSVAQYLEITLQKLKQQGSLSIQHNIIRNDRTFNAIAQIIDFELGLGMRGEAYFYFAEFVTLSQEVLQNYAARCLHLAKIALDPSTSRKAFYNFRVPTHLCFAIALVDQLDSETAQTIRTNNPFQHSVDAFWYEIPLVYELNSQQLHYYTKATNFWENFRGEIVWQKLRPIIQSLLA